MKKNKLIIYIFTLPIIVYIFSFAYLGITQKNMIYFPSNIAFEDCENFKKDEQVDVNGTKFYEQKGYNNNLIIYFHGNVGRACDRTYTKTIFENTSDSIIFVEYSGYTGDGKSPDMKLILNDVKNVGEYVNYYYKNKNIYVVGRSLGTGPASYYAQNFNTNKLLLISPYTNLYDVGSDKYSFFPIKHFFTQNFNPVEYLKSYKNNLLIIHGNKDNVVPIELGKKLFDGVNSSQKNMIVVENANHDNVISSKEIVKKIVEYLQ